MAQLITEILPFALGVFASPLPVIIAMALLFTPRPRPTSVTYVATWVVGVVAATVAFSLIAGALDGGQGPPSWLVWLRVILGLLLLVMAGRTWAKRYSRVDPAWLTMLMEAGPREAVKFGVAMSALNPKELLMAAGAGIALGTSGESPAVVAGALAVFVVVGACSVVAPLAVFVVGGDRSLESLSRWREWLQRHNAVVAACVLALLGVWLLVGGLFKVAMG
jgi:threonine/homoserine/homoserine lactone efflux protein